MANGKSPLELKRLAALVRDRKKSLRPENAWGNRLVEDKSKERKRDMSARERMLCEQFTRNVMQAQGRLEALAMRASIIDYTEPKPKPIPNRQRVNLRRYHKCARSMHQSTT